MTEKRTITIGDISLIYDSYEGGGRPQGRKGMRFKMEEFLTSFAVSLDQGGVTHAGQALILLLKHFSDLSPEVKEELNNLVLSFVTLNKTLSDFMESSQDLYVGDSDE
jgi:hypothetical protein